MNVDVINFHFTDNCNYHCYHCFVKKNNKEMSLENVKKVVDKIENYFLCENIDGRINLVGGEVFCCHYLQEIIDYINMKHIKVSLVTNGSLMSDDFIINNHNKLCSIGISVDSLVDKTNIKIGRCCKNITLKKEELIKKCELIKSSNISLKINLCLSKNNIDEDISSFIEKVKPDRFKIFQMTVIEQINDNSKNIYVDRNKFDNAVEKYKKYKPIIERDSEMLNSYVKIDSMGDLSVDGKQKFGNVITGDFIDMMKRIDIDTDSYNKRYVKM